MTSTELLGFVGALAFVGFIALCLRTTTKWGAETKKREEEFEKAAAVDVIDEQGQTLTLVRAALPESQPAAKKADGDITLTA